MQQEQLSSPSGHATIPDPGDPTYTEAWALVEAANRMAAPLETASLDDEANWKVLKEALQLNWRLWTIFQSELNLQENPEMPEKTRTDILRLCDFVDKQTTDALNDPTPEKIAGLIDINCVIAEGLLTSAELPTAS